VNYDANSAIKVDGYKGYPIVSSNIYQS